VVAIISSVSARVISGLTRQECVEYAYRTYLRMCIRWLLRAYCTKLTRSKAARCRETLGVPGS